MMLKSNISYRDLPYTGYRAGDDGSIWSCWTGTGPSNKISSVWRQLKAGSKPKGYLHVCVNHKTRLVHHLVLEAFVGPCPLGMQCRHLDGNPANNRPDNLVWGTSLENAKDRIRHGRHLGQKGESHGRAKLTNDDISKIYDLMAEGQTHKQIAARFGVSRSAIGEISRGRNWAHVARKLP
jgi:hypothetical protein